eukprot:CAMPEP_0183455402 /NCGR_PEP_ID=MMETSP0370-20130417/126568_1 /TAXON_ID=268820 /ORGANISM="Peridinium aciculiferum, Strain PAER-2" /LENGTH=70 /DNA_ID=CAMNT_0025646987 /DNA_START=47 /DNA_END=256 /DNA_ORIENTATION=+
MTTRKTQNAVSVKAQACLVAALVGCSMPASSKSLGVKAKRGRVAGSSLGGVKIAGISRSEYRPIVGTWAD